MSYRVTPQRCWCRALAPAVSPPLSKAPLHLIEWCVLWLIHADPRLSERFHRPRLRVLMGLLDESFTHHGRVGQALARVRDLTTAGAVSTRGFEKTRQRPTPELGEAAFVAALRGMGRQRSSKAKVAALREPFMRWLGVPPTQIVSPQPPTTSGQSGS